MEKNWISKTISVSLGSENYVIALMNKIGFKEEIRVATGGQMSDDHLMMTFGGYDLDYHENDYVKVDGKNDRGDYYYSLRCPNGYYATDFNDFKEFHKNSDRQNFEILTFTND